MGFYLNVMPGDGPLPADVRALIKQAILADGGEEIDGQLFYLGAMVLFPTNPKIDLDSSIASFRLSWGSTPDEVRLLADRLAQLCAPLDLRFDDQDGGTQPITSDAVERTVASFINGGKWAVGTFPPAIGDKGT